MLNTEDRRDANLQVGTVAVEHLTDSIRRRMMVGVKEMLVR